MEDPEGICTSFTGSEGGSASSRLYERKRFFGLMQRFIVPVAYRRAHCDHESRRSSASQQAPAIALLRQPHLYREDTGFGNLVQDLDEWIYF